MGCCLSGGELTQNYNKIDITSDEAPDGVKLGQDGSKGGTIPYYSTPGGGMTTSNTGSGPYVNDGSEHATGTSYTPEKMSSISTELGGLSEKYESNGNPGAIGYDSTGGWSYGKYQIAANPGTMKNFLSYLQINDVDSYNTLIAAGGNDGALSGSTTFQNAWKTLASNNPKFSTDQKGFIQSTHYDKAVSNIKNITGLDINTKSLAVQDVVWSTAVQNGPNSGVFKNAFSGKNANTMSDIDIVNAIYDERGKTSGGTLVYFSKSSASIQKSVANRFVNERQDALAMLKT